MSLPAITAHGAAALPNTTFRTHHRGAHGAAPELATLPSIGAPGQLPTGVGQGLIRGAVQSLARSVSGSPAASPSGAVGTRISAHA